MLSGMSGGIPPPESGGEVGFGVGFEGLVGFGVGAGVFGVGTGTGTMTTGRGTGFPPPAGSGRVGISSVIVVQATTTQPRMASVAILRHPIGPLQLEMT
ncbi:MAG: hypothetical protein DMF80_06700 [Acidobacteria bacterium]|nr:MAG: hypothetical protein DMF80_06700 [Acidobacteriota bacterium]